MSNFWDDLIGGYVATENQAIDNHLSDKKIGGAHATSLQALTDKGRELNAIPLPVAEGTRVSFLVNVGSVLSYGNPPEEGAVGTVVTVHTSLGSKTSHDGMVFVRWDGHSEVMPVDKRHLRVDKMRVASLGDLSEFLVVAGDNKSGELIHKSTEDMWSFQQDGDSWVIQRLFEESDDPIKG